MDEEKDVQEEQVSEQEPVSKGDEKPPEGEKPPEDEKPSEQALTEEKVQQMIAESDSKAYERGKREMQGIKNGEVAKALRRAEKAESRATAYDASVKGLDEDTQKDIELARLRGESQYYQTFEQQEEARRRQDAYFQQLDQSLKEEVEAMGIEPDDKRIDWAKDAPDFFAGRKRFSASLNKIQKENARVTEEKQAEKFAEMERKLRKDLGLDLVDTSTGPGGEGGGNPDKIIEAYGDGKVTREEYEKAMKAKGLSP